MEELENSDWPVEYGGGGDVPRRLAISQCRGFLAHIVHSGALSNKNEHSNSNSTRRIFATAHFGGPLCPHL
jgi:hypothetical protein